VKEDHGISDPYTQVEFSPPMTVRQLEDVSTVHNNNNNRIVLAFDSFLQKI
jgi:hypothetical protein